ncbi:redoxin family protein [Candidatus Fermentibacteria bacterium]|nr:redoxin family protein [Candidatus Fermentibacteria bacterium]
MGRSMARRVVEKLWVLLVLLPLIPVILTVLEWKEPSRRHGAGPGPFLAGRRSLDSLIDSSSYDLLLVNLWATWCPSCMRELPEIDDVYREKSEDLLAVAVCIDDPSLEEVRSYHSSSGLSMPIVWLSAEESADLRADWDLPRVLPVTLLFDPEGSELSRAAGARTGEFFRRMIAGAEVPADTGTASPSEMHVNVVGSPSDSAYSALLSTAVELAGRERVSVFDPSDPLQKRRMDSLHLPDTGYPYAQACYGPACGRPARSPQELRSTMEELID